MTNEDDEISFNGYSELQENYKQYDLDDRQLFILSKTMSKEDLKKMSILKCPNLVKTLITNKKHAKELNKMMTDDKYFSELMFKYFFY